jgi:hypothetical protein
VALGAMSPPVQSDRMPFAPAEDDRAAYGVGTAIGLGVWAGTLGRSAGFPEAYRTTFTSFIVEMSSQE